MTLSAAQHLFNVLVNVSLSSQCLLQIEEISNDITLEGGDPGFPVGGANT